MQQIAHPRSGLGIVGVHIPPRTVLQPTDVYDGSSGYWEECPCPGLELPEGAGATWVRPRPEGPLSKDGFSLLLHLSYHQDGLFSHIARVEGAMKLIPTRKYQWNGLLRLQSLLHPECIGELERFGYLTYDGFVYSLTDGGREDGRGLLR